MGGAGDKWKSQREPVFWVPDSSLGGFWDAVLRQLQQRVHGGVWGAGKGSVAGAPNQEEAGHQCDSRGCEVGQGTLCLLRRATVAEQEQIGDGEGSVGRAGERGMRTGRGSWSCDPWVQTGGPRWGWESTARVGHDLWRTQPLLWILRCVPLPLCSPPEDPRGHQGPPQAGGEGVTWVAHNRHPPRGRPGPMPAASPADPPRCQPPGRRSSCPGALR